MRLAHELAGRCLSLAVTGVRDAFGFIDETPVRDLPDFRSDDADADVVVVPQDSLDLMFGDERERDRWLAALRWALCIYPPDHPLAAQAAAQDSASDASGGSGDDAAANAADREREGPAVHVVGSTVAAAAAAAAAAPAPAAAAAAAASRQCRPTSSP